MTRDEELKEKALRYADAQVPKREKRELCVCSTCMNGIYLRELEKLRKKAGLV